MLSGGQVVVDGDQSSLPEVVPSFLLGVVHSSLPVQVESLLPLCLCVHQHLVNGLVPQLFPETRIHRSHLGPLLLLLDLLKLGPRIDDNLAQLGCLDHLLDIIFHLPPADFDVLCGLLVRMSMLIVDDQVLHFLPSLQVVDEIVLINVSVLIGHLCLRFRTPLQRLGVSSGQ